METFSCSTCAKSFTGIVPFEQHLNSAKHKKKVEQGAFPKTDFFCDTCNKTFNGPLPFKDHMVSPAHKKEAARKEIVARYVGDNPVNFSNSHLSSEIDVSNSENHASNCTIASVMGVQPFVLPTPFSYISNFRDNPYFSIDNGILSCMLCEVTFTGPENAASHFHGSKHIKNISKQQMKMKQNGMSENNCGAVHVNNSKNVTVQENISALSTKQMQYPEYNALNGGSSVSYDNESNTEDCQVCGIESFDTIEDMIKHFESENHQWNKINSRLPFTGKIPASFNNGRDTSDDEEEEEYHSCGEGCDVSDSLSRECTSYEALTNNSPVKTVENRMKIFDSDKPFCLDLN